MDTVDQEVEYLAPDDLPEDLKTELAPLELKTPLEHFKNLFDGMQDIRKKVILWEEKTKIKDSKSRDEAIMLRTTVTRTAKAIEDTYLRLTEPARDYLKQVRALATEAQVALIGTKDDPSLGVAGRLTVKVSDYAVECKRLEEEMKKKALAKQKLIEDEIEAWDMEAKFREERLQEEENLRLEQLREQALIKAQEEGHDEREVQTADLVADLALQEETARIEGERAKREKEQKDQQLENEKKLNQAKQETTNTFAVATGKGKVKGVQEIWTIELLDESLLDRKYLIYDETKVRAALKNGFYDKKEKDPEKIIPGCRCRLVLGKGGK